MLGPSLRACWMKSKASSRAAWCGRVRAKSSLSKSSCSASKLNSGKATSVARSPTPRFLRLLGSARKRCASDPWMQCMRRGDSGLVPLKKAGGGEHVRGGPDCRRTQVELIDRHVQVEQDVLDLADRLGGREDARDVEAQRSSELEGRKDNHLFQQRSVFLQPAPFLIGQAPAASELLEQGEFFLHATVAGHRIVVGKGDRRQAS